MNYITVIINPEKMQVGGFGHIMNDVLSAYIIAQLYSNITYVHSPILTMNDAYHKDCSTTKYNDEYFNQLKDWDNFLQFGQDEIQTNDVKHLPLKDLDFDVQPFQTISPEELQRLEYLEDTDTVYVLCQNKRVYLNEIYYYDRQKYEIIYNKLFNKLKHLKRPRDTNKLKVAIHIRRGDWDWQPLEYDQNIINLLESIIPSDKIEIHVHSLGAKDQLEQIRTHIKADKYHFNKDVEETFIDLYNADIVFGGHSCFPKIISLFTRNLFIYLPFNDGRTQVLGGGITGVYQCWGRTKEQIDPERCIMTDISINLNKNLIINKIINTFKNVVSTNIG